MPKNVNTLDLIKTVTFFASKNIIKKVGGGSEKTTHGCRKMHKYIPSEWVFSYLRDSVGSILDHHNEVNITIKGVTWIYLFHSAYKSLVYIILLMLKLKLQYFGHLMQRANWLEKTLMLGKIEDGRRRGQQRTRWLDGITDSMDLSLNNSGSWWWTGKRDMLQSTGSQRVGHDWATEQKFV